MNKHDAISKYMTPEPHTIGEDIPLRTAQGMMTRYGFRHLPVLRSGKLVGVISDRDLKLALSMGDMRELTVLEIMTEEPYSVLPDAELGAVLTEMAERKLGCAIVIDPKGKVAGLFTATDALFLFAKHLAGGGRNAA
jgi:acetoin utilization protein AcuB